MNVFVGGVGACSVHNENYIITNALINKGYSFTQDYTDADLIILSDMCVGSGENINITFNYLINVLKEKKKDAEIILSGCLSNGFKYELIEETKKILDQVKIVPTDKLIEYVFDEYINDSNKQKENQTFFPISKINNHGIRISPVAGCLNNCSFCKSHYANFELKSYSLDMLEQELKPLEDRSFINYVSIISSNFSLYGVDLYGEQKAHEVIKMFNNYENIKYISIGAIINWYPELVKEILDNPKIKEIYTSLETGSPRLYTLMNRPISLENWIKTIRTIRENRPDILINTEVISGFPTETVDDIKMTVDLIKELGIYNNHIYPYKDFACIPSSKLPQHSLQYSIHSGKYLKENLSRLNAEIENEIEYGEMYILNKFNKERCYIALLINGTEKPINFECFDREYEIGDFVPKGATKNKIYAKIKNCNNMKRFS